VTHQPCRGAGSPPASARKPAESWTTPLRLEPPHSRRGRPSTGTGAALWKQHGDDLSPSLPDGPLGSEVVPFWDESSAWLDSDKEVRTNARRSAAWEPPGAP